MLSSYTCSLEPRELGLTINLRPGLFEFVSLFLEPALNRYQLVDLLLRGIVPHLLGDLHRAEVRTAHRTKVRELGALLRQGFVVVLASQLGIQREAELVFP